jgi:precorrin-2 dehydrogenase / sirohydrochlorin ferrochelatase
MTTVVEVDKIRMIEVCEKYSLDELVQLNDEDMNRLLMYYKDGIVPPYRDVHIEKPVFEFDGSFGWHC